MVLMVLATLLVGTTACNGNKEQNSQQKGQPEQQESTKQNIIRKRLSIPSEFGYITNLGSVDIIYTQGDFSVEAEGDSTTLSYLKTEFDSNLLTVSVSSDNNADFNRYGNTSNIKLYVSCPDLVCVSICGNGGFESVGTWSTDKLQFGCMGSGALKLDQVECTDCDIQASDRGEIRMEKLQARNVSLFSYGTSDIDINFNTDTLVVLNEGKQHIRLRGQAQKVVIKKPNDPNLTNELNVMPTVTK